MDSTYQCLTLDQINWGNEPKESFAYTFFTTGGRKLGWITKKQLDESVDRLRIVLQLKVYIVLIYTTN